jgi:hypothetical protein
MDSAADAGIAAVPQPAADKADTAAANRDSAIDPDTAASAADTAAVHSDSNIAASAAGTAAQAAPGIAVPGIAAPNALHSAEVIPDVSAAWKPIRDWSGDPSNAASVQDANAPAAAQMRSGTRPALPPRLQPHGASHLVRLCSSPHSSSAPAFQKLVLIRFQYLLLLTALSDHQSSDHP